MGTIKILGFDEDGNAQRLKIRIARFLDYDPVTASDKSNIRSTLGITSQGGLGDLLAANNLDDVASLDTTKANLEIPDVGTDPSEVPLNQHLGSMAYQSADSVSIGKAEIESTTGTATTQALTITDGSSTNFVVQEDGLVGVGTSSPSAAYKLDVSGDIHTNAILRMTRAGDFALYPSSNNIVYQLEQAGSHSFKTNGSVVATIDSSGRLGVNQTSPGSYNAAADDLVVGDGSGDRGLTIASGNASQGGIYFADGTSGSDQYAGGLIYYHNLNRLDFYTAGGAQWFLGSNGNLIAASAGNGIDFGSGASTTLDNYEHGDITSVTDASGAGLGITADLKYQVIGKSVQISGKIIFPVTADTNAAQVTLLPEQCPNDDGARGLSVSYSTIGSAFYVLPLGGTNDVMFYTVSGSTMSNNALSGVAVFISGNYSIN